MQGQSNTAIFITFLLAMIGYAGLTAVVLLSRRSNVPLRLWRATAAVILIHVLMVWTFRYEWHFAEAVRNGYAGFVVFHAALVMILVSTVSTVRVSRLLIRISFVLVSLGAVGATFLYDVVAIYRIPVILCAVAGGVALAWTYLHRGRMTAPAADGGGPRPGSEGR